MQYLTLLIHSACIVFSSGYAGGGRHVVYGGNCTDALAYAQAISGQVINALGQVVWPV